MNILEFTAKELTKVGIPVIPTGRNKIFLSQFGKEHNGTARSWLPFINNLATDKEIKEWIKSDASIAMVMKGYECIDFDNKIPDIDIIYNEALKTLTDTDESLKGNLYTERTPSGGYHIIYKYSGQSSNQALASRVVDGKKVTFIETRGGNGYAVIAPSSGYTAIDGDLTSLKDLSQDQRDLVIATMMSYNEAYDDVFQHRAASLNGDALPGKIYSEKGDHKSLLERHGWSQIGRNMRGELWARPGKRTVGGTWNGTHFFVFTSSTNLENNKGYNLFALRTALEFNGDYKAASRQLRKEGFVDKNEYVVYADGSVASETDTLVPKKKKKGKEPEGNFVPIEELEAAISAKYQLRYNIIKGRNEVCEGSRWDVADDRFEMELWRELRATKYPKLTKQYVQDVLMTEFCPTFHPFHDYFDSLPGWDGYDYISDFARRVQTDSYDEEKWQTYFRRWIIALVACARDGRPNHSCIVLQGDQGVGKTTWVESLLPPPLKQYINKGHFAPHDKDAKIMTAENIIINLDELESSTRDEMGVLKSLITTESVNVRRPYGRRSEVLKRTASFIGSVNQTNFLNDVTGSRRFLVIKAVAIDNSQPVNHSQLYAQAMNLYRGGEKYWFDGKEIQEITLHNKQYEVMNIEEELLNKHYKPYEWDEFDPNSTEHRNLLKRKVYAMGGNHKLMTASEIYMDLQSKAGGNARVNSYKVSQALKSLGYINVRMSSGNKLQRYYAVVQLEQNELMQEIMREEIEEKSNHKLGSSAEQIKYFEDENDPGF